MGAGKGAFATGRRVLLPVVLFGSAAFPGAGIATPPPPSERPHAVEESTPGREASPFEAGARAAAARLREGTALTVDPDAVEFALLLYAETGTASDLERAARLARARATQDQAGALRGLYLVAWAGGSTLPEAEALFTERQKTIDQAATGSTAAYADAVLEMFARAAARGDRTVAEEAYLAAETFLERRTDAEGDTLEVLDDAGEAGSLADHVGALRVALQATAWSGSPELRDVAEGIGKTLLAGFWDERGMHFSVPDGGGGSDTGEIGAAEASLSLWETGFVTGDTTFMGTAALALATMLPSASDTIGSEASADEDSPAVGLTAWRLAHHPVQMALVGDPADSTLRALREASWFHFEPRKVLLSLDPAADVFHLQALGYPAEYAPALFVCVETVCSPPLRSAEGLGGKVKEILNLAGGGAR